MKLKKLKRKQQGKKLLKSYRNKMLSCFYNKGSVNGNE
jgi:hypothetical protein